MDLKTKKRTKMHHIITITFCYFPCAWLITLWVAKFIQLDYHDFMNLGIPLALETLIFVAYCQFSDNIERMESVIRVIAGMCPTSFVPFHIRKGELGKLRKTLYHFRVCIFILLLATFPWHGEHMSFLQCATFTVITCFLVILQSTYYLFIYYEMFGKFKNKKDGI